jgi:hypothetical protein
MAPPAESSFRSGGMQETVWDRPVNNMNGSFGSAVTGESRLKIPWSHTDHAVSGSDETVIEAPLPGADTSRLAEQRLFPPVDVPDRNGIAYQDSARDDPFLQDLDLNEVSSVHRSNLRVVGKH